MGMAKVINYEFGVGREMIEGSVEVDDDATRQEIEAVIFDEVTSCGKLGFNWYVDGE